MSFLVSQILPVLRRPTLAEVSAPPTPESALRPLLRPSTRRLASKDAIVEPRTGPLDTLRGGSVLVALDLENIDRSAHDIGRVVDYGRLAHVMRNGIGSCAASRPRQLASQLCSLPSAIR
jgi:hypothetical protein